MMARSIDEIIDLKRKLKKETSSDGVLDILKVLDKLQVTRKILEDTRIGKTIAKIATKSNFADEVTALAKSLLKRWKKTAKMERNSTSPKGAEDTAIPKDETRKKVCYMFKETFTGKENGIDEGKNTGRELEISVQIETAMFNAYGSDPQAKEYKAKFRSLKFNLGKNEHIRNQLLEGTVKPEELVSMKPAEVITFVSMVFTICLVSESGKAKENCRGDAIRIRQSEIGLPRC